MQYSKNAWLFSVHNFFKELDGDSSAEAYRKVIDAISFFDEMYDGGESPQFAYEMYWESEELEGEWK